MSALLSLRLVCKPSTEKAQLEVVERGEKGNAFIFYSGSDDSPLLPVEILQEQFYYWC